MYIHVGQFIFTCTCKANSKLQVKIYEIFDVILLFAGLLLIYHHFTEASKLKLSITD